jgi:hypothetical protein
MRIEIDQELEKRLDAVKTKKWISGKACPAEYSGRRRIIGH